MTTHVEHAGYGLMPASLSKYPTDRPPVSDTAGGLRFVRLRRIIASVFTFIELQPFARVRETMLVDEEFARMQEYLIAHPKAGDVIPGSGGCRKLRWALSGRGKRGGARVVYFIRISAGEIVLVTMYAKNVKDDVDAGLLKKLRQTYEEDKDGTQEKR